MNLVRLTENNLKIAEVVTTHTAIAEFAGLQRQSVKRLIDNHKKDLEQFGRLGFEIRPFEGSRGQKAKIYYLNRNQAMLLITYLDNTKPVRKFKQELIKRFDEMEKELSVRKLERAIEKQHGKTLTEAIEHWKYCNSHSFQNIRQLLTKTVTGLNARELRKQRSDGEKYILLDLLTAEELAEYKRLEALVTALIVLNVDYPTIKMSVETTRKAIEV